MDNFEMFLQLDDLKGVAADNAAKMLDEYRADKPEIITNEGWEESSIEDESPEPGAWDFLEDGEDIKFEDEVEREEATTESDNMEDAPDVIDPDSEEYDYNPESYDVDFDTVITLPNGADMTIETLSNGYLAGEELRQREAEFEEKRKVFEQREAAAKTLMDLSLTECDQVIADYEGFDWDRLAIEDPHAYVENKRYLERYQRKQKDLIATMHRVQAEKQAQEEATFRAKSIACVQVLKSKIPEWNDKHYGDLIDFAIDELGANEDEILKENRPSIILALHNAYKWHNAATYKTKATIKGSPRSVIKPGNTPAQSKTSMVQSQAEEAYAKGRMSQEEAFKFLQD